MHVFLSHMVQSAVIELYFENVVLSVCGWGGSGNQTRDAIIIMANICLNIVW